MRIVYLITGLGMGGAENLVVNLAHKASLKGHKVTIIYLTGPKIVELQDLSINVISLGMEKKIDLLKAYILLRKLIINLNPDVIHSHMVHANILARLLRVTVKVKKLICTIHNTNEGSFIRTIAYRITDYLADVTTSVSEDAVQSAIDRGAVPAHRIICIPNGTDTEKFSRKSEAKDEISQQFRTQNKKILVAAGRLDRAKDYPNLFEALAILKETRDDFILLIAGSGPLKDELESLSNRLSLNDHIVFLGIYRQMPKLFSAADVFILSSEWEGLPLVLGEAMSCECIIAATDCGGIREYVGEIDSLVPIKNPNSLAVKINEHLNISEQNKSEYRLKCRERIESLFSIDSMTDKYLNLYSQRH